MAASTKTKVVKLPKDLAAVADMYKEARDARLAKAKEIESLAAKESLLREHLINNLPKSQAGGVQGKIARVEIVLSEIPTFDMEDEAARDKFFKFAHRKGNEDLIVESMNAKAVKERWDAGKEVPGVIRFKVKKLSLHTVKQKRK